MKTRVLAVLLAVCMIAGTCVLFASAATLNEGSYVKLINPKGGVVADNLTTISGPGTGYNIPVNATAKTSGEVNVGTTSVTADNVDNLVTFKKNNSSTMYFSELTNYYSVSGTITGNPGSTEIYFESKDANKLVVYKVKETFDPTTTTDILSKLELQESAEMYSVTPSPLSVGNIKFVTKLCTVTTGVRFFGTTYENLSASEIAQVEAEVTRYWKSSPSVTTYSVTNDIRDLQPGDFIKLTTKLKDDADAEFYKFYCWVDSNGNVISENPTYPYTVEGKDVAFYATYVEIKDRHRISYISNGNGKLIYNEGREVFDGKAKTQISVLGGRDATFTFVPDEGYEVSKVVIDKGTPNETNVASFKSINLEQLLKGNLSSLKNLINATNKDVYSYTFPKVAFDHSIEVTFSPITVLEAPSGKDLPTVEAEGITLATGAAAENGEGGEGGANGGNSANGTTVPGENGAAGSGSAIGGVVNPATGSTGAIAVFAALSVAAAAAFITAKKKED